MEFIELLSRRHHGPFLYWPIISSHLLITRNFTVCLGGNNRDETCLFSFLYMYPFCPRLSRPNSTSNIAREILDVLFCCCRCCCIFFVCVWRCFCFVLFVCFSLSRWYPLFLNLALFPYKVAGEGSAYSGQLKIRRCQKIHMTLVIFKRNEIENWQPFKEKNDIPLNRKLTVENFWSRLFLFLCLDYGVVTRWTYTETRKISLFQPQIANSAL